MEKTIKKLLLVSILTLGVVVAVGVIVVLNKEVDGVGSVTQANEYKSTSTPYASVNADRLIKKGQGALGTLVVTTAGNVAFDLLNATTTAGTRLTATSSILLASIPASLSAGTYTFDVLFTDGLFMDVQSGSLGTSTITYR